MIYLHNEVKKSKQNKRHYINDSEAAKYCHKFKKIRTNTKNE